MDWENRTVSLLLCLSILIAAIHNGNAERKIVCYYTNWSIYRPGTAKFSPQNINPYLCTHLIYAFGGFTKDNALKPFDKYQDIEKGGYAKFNGLKTYNKNLKTLLAIGGWNEGSSRFSPMVADPERRREFVKNAVKFLRKNHFDGLDLDWEYPAFRDGGKPRDKDNYASLVQELREEFERESSKTGRPRLLLTLAMPAGIDYIDKGYDVPRLNEYLDFINLLSYDYHSSYEPAVNHHSPLYPLEEDNEYNYDAELTIDYTVNYLLKKGASPEKIVLGIPTYGRSYTLFNQDATDLGSPADGPGIKGDATREDGYLAYYEICEGLAQSGEWEVIQPNPKAMGPYAFKGDQWVGYDDEDMVRLKASYANQKNLGGIMFWTIDNDDFRGKCHDRPYPLIEAAKETLLTADSTNTVARSKTVDTRKKPRIQAVQSNIVRKSGSGGRRTTTTAAPAPKKRVSSSRPKYRTFSRSKASDEEEEEEGQEEEEEEGQEVDRRSFDPISDEEGNSNRGNAVRTVDKSERSSNKNKVKWRNRPSSNRNRRKHNRGNEESRNDDSLSNKPTTPEPPTTPDPGTDFKCEDEGFFPHPRDCKKYFWCLESGPGGLGVVAHQFTCPSGLVFNKAADSCDYPRNVVCPKSKSSQTTASTTRAPITAATSRTTYLYSTTRKPTTEKPESEEQYEYYDEDDEEAEEEEEEEEEKQRSKVTAATPKPLLYKTITRSRPSTTSIATTPTTSKPERNEPEKVLDLEDEEDPKVIKELIKLIKKAGGLEQLEKQLLVQDKNSESSGNSGSENATPATISRTLYERVLNRQANKGASGQATSTSRNFKNGPGRAQFEGLDEVPEVKSLRRSQKPQYVTIERPRPPTKEPPVEEEEDVLDEDSADVASSEEQTVSNPFLASSTQRATPNYINIRRARPSTPRNESDVKEKNKDAEEEVPIRRRRPIIQSPKNTEASSPEDKDQESSDEENSQTTKSRYVSVQRFRSTTPQSAEVSGVSSSDREAVTEATISTEAAKVEPQNVPTTPITDIPSSIVLSSTPNDIVVDSETEKSSVTTPEASSTTESLKLVEDSATEILLTTAPASLSTLPVPRTRISTASVSQPRPFGFNRRNRPSSEPTTTPLPVSNDQTRSKVTSLEVNRLPTLKELIGYRSNDRDDDPSPVSLSLQLPLATKDQEDFSRKNTIVSNDTEQRWTTTKHEQNGYAQPKYSNLSVDDINAYYVEENIADNQDDSSTSKKRFDREDSVTTTFAPTTMRGIPLTDLLQSQAPRGFYVTKSETKSDSTSELLSKNEGLTTRVTMPGGDDFSIIGEETVTNSKEKSSKPSPEATTIFDYALPTSRVRSTISLIDEEKVETSTSQEVTSTTCDTDITDTLIPEEDIPPTPDVTFTESGTTLISQSIDTTIKELVAKHETTLSLLNTDYTASSSAIEATDLYTQNIEESTTADSKESYSTSRSLFNETDEAGQNFTNENENSRLTTTLRPTSATQLSKAPVARTETAISRANRRRQKVELNAGYEFGRKSQRRGQNSVSKSSNVDREASERKGEKARQPPLLRVIRYRGRHRRPNLTTTPASNIIVRKTTHTGNRDVVEKSSEEFPRAETTTASVEEAEMERTNSVENVNNEEGSKKEKELLPKVNETRKGATKEEGEEEKLRIEGNNDRYVPEVNTSKNIPVTSRIPGNLPSTRLRKPTTFTLTPLQNRTPNTLANQRRAHLSEGNASLVDEKIDIVDEIAEARKAEKDIDQSSKAQEIAVTLADPPAAQSSATGQPPLRNALRRKISTTVAPRTDATTSRTTLRFTPAARSRQKAKTQDKPLQNVTTRPRRPPVIDYDYYEDEEEPVVGKSSFNGKLFLTSKGTIRCLDQGNFPHPDSCKKFIICAKMVNGLVIGAEYTCPDKLSFDPVGGICNWSAGLGCKE